MPYRELETLSGAEFKRLCGVPRATCSEMVEVVRLPLERQRQRGLTSQAVCEDQLLMVLEYWRKYRSQFGTGLLTCDR
jgi:hypothetical protein